MTFRLGLTGSIGMGKSTTAAMFAELGCAVWDADAAVHALYAPDGGAVSAIAEKWPEVIVDKSVSREKLRHLIAGNPDTLRQIEAIVHPLVARDRAQFAERTVADIAVFDIPLLFETNGDAEMDAVACVSVAFEVQRARVLGRGTMTEAQFESILAKQMPIEEKRCRSDYVIETDTLDHAQRQVAAIVQDIRKGSGHA